MGWYLGDIGNIHNDECLLYIFTGRVENSTCIYNYYNIFMVSWWVTDSYFNNELIQTGDIEIMSSAYGSSGSFGSWVMCKSIGNNT